MVHMLLMFHMVCNPPLVPGGDFNSTQGVGCFCLNDRNKRKSVLKKYNWLLNGAPLNHFQLLLISHQVQRKTLLNTVAYKTLKYVVSYLKKQL